MSSKTSGNSASTKTKKEKQPSEAVQLRNAITFANLPCHNCYELEDHHVEGKCLFGATLYRAYKRTELCWIRYVKASKRYSKESILYLGAHSLTSNVTSITFTEGPCRRPNLGEGTFWLCMFRVDTRVPASIKAEGLWIRMEDVTDVPYLQH